MYNVKYSILKLMGDFMDLINRYIYAVIKQLTKDEKEEAKEELQLLIYEKMKEYPDSMDEKEKARLVIEKLGNPDKLADKYRSQERCLIGGSYYYKYINVLKIVLIAIFIGTTIASILAGITNYENIIIIIIKYFSNLFQSLLQGVAWVTIIFAIFQYNNINLSKETSWSIKDLPNIPRKKSMIPKGESIAAIIFTAIFFSILLFSPQLIGIYYYSHGELVNIPLFNLEVLSGYHFILISIFAIEILQESLKILWGVWTKKRALIFTVTSIISTSLGILFLSSTSVWNSKACEIITKYSGFEITTISNSIVMLIIVVAFIEILTTLYKGLKYD